MAHMHPSTLTPGFTGYKFSSEKAVFDRASAELPDSYHVFHDLKWDDPSIDHGKTRGEIDFVIVHPDYGFITLEVKGGRCSYEPEFRAWSSKDGNNQVHDIKDPFDQAAAAGRAILEMLRRQPQLRDVFIHHHHAAVFPGCILDKRDIRADVHGWQILDQESLSDFKRAIDRLFRKAFPKGPEATAYGKRILQGISVLHGNKALIGKTSVSLRISRAEDELIRLTDTQFSVLKQLRDSRRTVIRGCAGSGKTTLAMHKARMLAEEGKDVLLVCFNQPLSSYLKKQCEQLPSVTAGAFHNLCLDWLDEIDCPYTQSEDDAFYSVTLPNLVADHLDAIPHRYDAVIVDEGQDFKDSYWTLLEFLLKNPKEAVFYIFADSGQNIYEGTSDYPMAMFPFRLDKNLRNTDQVFKIVKHACELPDEIESSGVTGPGVRFMSYKDDDSMMQQLESVIAHLIQEGVSPNDIAVLGTRSQSRTALQYGQKIGPFELVEARNGDNQILTMTIHRFKGLESPVVILCELDESVRHNQKELMYIGLTRATGLLCVLARESAAEQYKEMLGI